MHLESARLLTVLPHQAMDSLSLAELRHALIREKLLRDIGEAIYNPLSLETICHDIAYAFSRYFPGSACIISLPGEKRRQRISHAANLPYNKELTSIEKDYLSTPPDEMMHARPVVLPNHNLPFLTCPVIRDHRLDMIITLTPASHRTQWSEQDIDLLASGADALARLLERLTLQEAMTRARQELEQKASDLEASLTQEQALNRMQRSFMSMVSHEFLTPLTIIDSCCQLITRRYKDSRDDYLTTQLARIVRSSERLANLVNSTLQLARLEDGRLSFRPVKIALQDRIASLAERHRTCHPQHHLRIEIPQTPVILQGDPSMLDHILINLLENATKYSPAGSSIYLNLRVDARHAVVTVRDEGIGIPADEIDRVFEKFFRASNVSKTAGTGIGLFLARYFTELHHGTLTAESQEDKGSTFTLKLPLESDTHHD